MKITWLADLKPLEASATSNEPWLFGGKYAGGAEMTDAGYRSAAPPGTEFHLLESHEWEQALDAELLVISASNLSDDAMTRLAAKQPVMLLHHLQARSAARRYLIEKARRVVVHTPAHADKEASWTERTDFDLILSPIDPAECWSEPEKLERATWAARMHPLKGPLRARYWAASRGIPLDFLTSVERSVVLEHMARNRYWIFLPLEWGSESRGTIEAVLSGAECIVNENVSLMSYERWNDKDWLAEQVSEASARFWQCALS